MDQIIEAYAMDLFKLIENALPIKVDIKVISNIRVCAIKLQFPRTQVEICVMKRPYMSYHTGDIIFSGDEWATPIISTVADPDTITKVLEALKPYFE